MVDYLLLALAIILSLAGLMGCFIPVLPGPPLNWLGLLLLNFTRFAHFTNWFLIVWLIITVVVTVMDYIIPIMGARKFGGSKQGIWGATLGMLAGIFIFPPLGLIILPFLGAYLGELLAGKESRAALHAALGTFIGFLLSTGIKLAASLVMIVYFVKAFFH